MRHPDLFDPKPVEIVLFEDVMSPWCWLAERRIAAVVEEFGSSFTPLRHAPFALRPDERLPSATERRALARELRRAAREVDGSELRPDLWLSGDPPASSFPGLVALAAARLQGTASEGALREALRSAALHCGVNVARPDVLLEVAERTGLDMARFAGALAAPATRRAVRCAHEAAVDKGVECVPSLAIGDEWLVAGLRGADEYREILSRFLATRVGAPADRVLH